MTKRPSKKRQKNDQTIYLRLELETLAALDLIADQQSRTRSSLIQFALKQWVKEANESAPA